MFILLIFSMLRKNIQSREDIGCSDCHF